MAYSPRALEFAHRRLASLTILSGLGAAEIYDRLPERVRHAVLLIHSFVPRDRASELMPLLDLLTSLSRLGPGRLLSRAIRFRMLALLWIPRLDWSWLLRLSWC